ncbi:MULTISPECIES: MobF family relaxase [unclassified Streptomyces]|uniref:MobF family relaxase n=1 Tax=unclassified Streptomyces TaxID=2593676 RepID=UPI0009964DD7|nr:MULTISPECIES: MobF family relaxase [unclassified Streptomyces]
MRKATRPAKAERAARLGYRVQKFTAIDFVFRPPGSIQILWALADPHTRRVIETLHLQVLREVMTQEVEEKLLIVRVGKDSVRQLARPGVMAARFRHYTSRKGGPLLHDHVLMSVKVKRTDGGWGTLHTRTLLEHVVACSERYNQRILEEVCTRLGLATEPRFPTAGQRPVMEIAGIPEELINWAASRNQAIMERLGSLEELWVQRTGGPVSVKVRRRLMAMAADETRPAKDTARPLSQWLAHWRSSAIARLGRAVVDNLLRLARAAARGIRARARAVLDVAVGALEITATVSQYYPGGFRRRHLLAEARRYLTRVFRGRPVPVGADEALVTAAMEAHCVDVSPPRAPDLPAPVVEYRRLMPRWAPVTDTKTARGGVEAAGIYYRTRAEAVRRMSDGRRGTASVRRSRAGHAAPPAGAGQDLRERQAGPESGRSRKL